MSFLDQDPDLSATRFSTADLRYAREYLVHVIERHDPSWLSAPDGPLGAKWCEGGTNQAVFLIDFAQMLYAIDHNSTKRSKRFLIRRFVELLHANERQFDEVLTELQVIATFTGKTDGNPIDFEPLVPDDALAHTQPPSPDYCIHLKDGDAYIEVTVFYLGVLMAWNEAAERIKKAIQGAIVDQNGVREVILSFPPKLMKSDISDKALQALCRSISNSETGKATLRVGGETAFVEWNAPTLIQSSGLGDVRMVGRDFSLQGTGVEFGALVSVSTRRLRADASEVVLKSIRNTLRRKRSQAPRAAMYFVVIKLGHHLIDGSIVQQLIYERIWPNDRYQWLSGIIAFDVKYSMKNGFEPSMSLLLNPNSTNPASPALRTIFDG